MAIIRQALNLRTGDDVEIEFDPFGDHALLRKHIVWKSAAARRRAIQRGLARLRNSRTANKDMTSDEIMMLLRGP